MIDPELIEDTRKRILYRLLIVNGGILIVAGGLGYLLAGRTLNPIAEMVEEQHRFVSDASHELKTPLTSIKTAMEVFLRDKRHTLADASDLIKDSIKDIDKLAQLSESLLRLAHQEGQPSLSLLRDIQLDDVIGDALKRTMPLAKKKQIGVVVGDMKATVSGTRDSLTEVFVILLDNAVKYSPKGSEVSVSGIRRNGMYQISVRDQGMGISVIDQKHIFDRFYRADNARTGGESGGYGLGLSIARKIITEHKGTITVSSREGEGSEFIVTLPVRRRNTS
jgi:signal transduction histidine kinase